MAVDISGGGSLGFVATVDTDKFLQDLNRMEQELNDFLQKSEAQGESANRAIIQQRDSINQTIKAFREAKEAGKGAFDGAAQSSETLRKSILQLQIQMDSYRAIVQKSTDPAVISKYNAEIEKLERTIRQLQNIGKTGFDAMGKPLKEQLGLLGQLERAAKIYRQGIQQATNEQNIVKYNQRLQETNREIERLKNAGKAGFDSMGNAIQQSTGALGGLKTMLVSVAGALGFIGIIQTVIQLGKELFDIAQKAEGVELAFSRIGSAADLEKLRQQTRGTVSDLELMQAAVKASNFKMPLDTLGKGLAFAQQRAKDTGQEVDYLVNSLVDGIGRKSTLVLDNLGLSAAEVQAEFQKTGDFAVAVGNIIEREMEKSGDAVATLGEQTDQTATSWQNFKKDVADFFREYFNPKAVDTSAVGKMTEAMKKQIGELDKLTQAQRDREIYMLEQQQKAIKETLSGQRGLDLRGVNVQELKEQAIANQNILSLLKQRNEELKEEERIQSNILSIAELQAKAEELKKQAYDIQPINAQDVLRRKELLKEAEDIRKQIDEILGKQKASRGRKDNYDEVQAYENMLQRIAELDQEYTRKSLNKDEAELQAVRDKFKKIAFEVEKYNKDPKNTLKVDVAVLDPIRDRAIADLQYKQGTDALKKSLDEQKQLYEEYEQFKDVFGAQRAQERFKKEIDFTKTHLQKVQEELKALREVPADQLTPLQQDRYKELLEREKEAIENRRDLQDKQYADALKASETFETKKLAIAQKYAKLEEALRQEPDTADNAKRLQELALLKEAELDAVKEEAFQKTKIYQDLNDNLIEHTKKQISFQIAAIEEVLATAKNLTDKQRAALEEDIRRLQALAGTAAPVNDTQTGATLRREASLKKQAALLKESLATQELSTQEYREQAALLGEIEQQLSAMAQEKFAAMAEDASNVSKELAEWSAILAPIDEDLSHAVGTAGELASVFGDAAMAAASFAAGDIIGGIKATVTAISKLVTIGQRVKEMNAQARAEVEAFYDSALKGEREYQRLLRQRELDQIRRNKATLEGIEAEKQALMKQVQAVKNDYISMFNELREQEFIVDSEYKHGTWFRKAETKFNMASLGGKSYEEMEQLYLEGRLKDKAKEDFEALKALKEELEAIGLTLEDLQEEYKKIWTGTTADAIVDSITAAFREGKTAAADFADSFEEMMKNAALNAFKYQVLEKQIQQFYDAFAADSESGGTLTEEEIARLQEMYNTILKDAAAKFEELKNLTGLDFGSGDEQTPNALAGAIRGMTEAQAELLAGQFNAMRLHMAELVQLERMQTGADPVSNMMLQQTDGILAMHTATLRSIEYLGRIEQHTAQTVEALAEVVTRMDRQLNVQSDQANSLKSIDRKTVQWGETLRANGWTV